MTVRYGSNVLSLGLRFDFEVERDVRDGMLLVTQCSALLKNDLAILENVL